MAGLWDFFAGAKEITAADLPLVEDQREPSPEDRGVWSELKDFALGAEVRDSELPAAADRLGSEAAASPAASEKKSPTKAAATPNSKRGRDQMAATSVSPVVAAVEEKLADRSASKKLTKDELSEYLSEKGEQVPPGAKKDKLLTLARTASQAEATPAAPEVASPKAKAPVSAAASPSGNERPSQNWPIARMRTYAEENKVELPPKALKHEIFEAVLEHSTGVSRRTSTVVLTKKSTSKAKASVARKSTSMTRTSSKKK